MTADNETEFERRKSVNLSRQSAFGDFNGKAVLKYCNYVKCLTKFSIPG